MTRETIIGALVWGLIAAVLGGLIVYFGFQQPQGRQEQRVYGDVTYARDVIRDCDALGLASEAELAPLRDLVRAAEDAYERGDMATARQKADDVLDRLPSPCPQRPSIE